VTVSIPLIALVALVVYVATSAAPQIRSVLAGIVAWLQSTGKG
jgi:hypothetical protein